MSESEISGTLTPEQLQELQDICGDMIDISKELVDDYIENPSDTSGSVVYRIHENSPYVDEKFSDTGWKHVLKTDVPEIDVRTGEDVLENLDKEKDNAD